jgi:hypothetical protein
MKMTALLKPLPTLRTHGATPLFPHVFMMRFLIKDKDPSLVFFDTLR